MISFPLPVSPVISTDALVLAMRSAVAIRRWSAGLCTIAGTPSRICGLEAVGKRLEANFGKLQMYVTTYC